MKRGKAFYPISQKFVMISCSLIKPLSLMLMKKSEYSFLVFVPTETAPDVFGTEDLLGSLSL